MIAGVATLTMVVSTMIMKNPTTKAQSAGHGSLSTAVAGAGFDVSTMESVNTLVEAGGRQIELAAEEL